MFLIVNPRLSGVSFKSTNKNTKDLFFLLFIINLRISSVSFKLWPHGSLNICHGPQGNLLAHFGIPWFRLYNNFIDNIFIKLFLLETKSFHYTVWLIFKQKLKTFINKNSMIYFWISIFCNCPNPIFNQKISFLFQNNIIVQWLHFYLLNRKEIN